MTSFRHPRPFAPWRPIALALALSAPLAANAYYSGSSYEGVLTIKGIRIITDFSTKSKDVDKVNAKDLNKASPLSTSVRAKINRQLDHLIGTFQSSSFLDKKTYGDLAFGVAGILGEEGERKIEITSVKPVSTGPYKGLREITYNFESQTVFDRDAWGAKDKVQVPWKLPLVLKTANEEEAYDAYTLGCVLGGECAGTDNPGNVCTDAHYNSLGDYWYFWDPDRKPTKDDPRAACPLRKVKSEEIVLDGFGTLKKLPNTVGTNPDYERMYAGNELKIAVFVGYIGEHAHRLSKFKRHTHNGVWRNDDGQKSFQEVSRLLREAGCVTQRSKSISGFHEDALGRQIRDNNGADIIHYCEKDLSSKMGRPFTVKVTSMLADTQSDSTDRTFHNHILRPALLDSDLVFYDGHSGLGANLDIKTLKTAIGDEHFRFRPTKFQIFYFNGCSTYPYFRSMFFDAKAAAARVAGITDDKDGTKSLNVITSGQETDASTTAPNIMAFIGPFLDGKKLNYQQILAGEEASNGDIPSYLIGVNGDRKH